MVKFDYVEDYLEVIAGHRDTITGKLISTWIFNYQPIISLARYDVNVVESMASAVTQGQALTERQGELACKIILKYQRQLAAKLVDVGPVETPKWRMPLRSMDYSRSLVIVDNQLILHFPFVNELIEQLREFAKSSQGHCRWDREKKHWAIALTEYNLSWSHTWATLNKFAIDPAVTQLMNRIADKELTRYAIELYITGDRLAIRNAESSLIDFINEKAGGFGTDNLLRLVDMSAVLGFTVDPDLAQALIVEYTPRFYNLASNRELKINPYTLLQTDNFESVIQYANLCQRWPVVVYEPDLSHKMLDKLKSLCPDDFYYNRHDKAPTIDAKYKFIHTYVPIQNLTHIPLIISSAGMMFGGDKQLMFQRAEKIVYCAQDVYNKKIPKKIKEL